ncbi:MULTISPECIES: hypothetical protein [Halorubrum]|uniref:hypothetical protein n=1 Tax=Halorubrum TaxID=56688 RepID=UPI00111196FB|nr:MULTISPECIES: hypothetical protein [Halorubrum]
MTDTGAERGEDRGTVTGDPETVPGIPFTTTAQLEPETEQVFEGVFTEPVYYAAHHTVDGAEPANSQAEFAFNPAPPDRENTSFLEVQIDSSGVFGWVINTTENLGPFDS